ncbi:unnamed protein product, partial [Urochloa humidicola]
HPVLFWATGSHSGDHAGAIPDPVLGYRSSPDLAARKCGRVAASVAAPVRGPRWHHPAAVCRALRRREARPLEVRVLGRCGPPEPAHSTRSWRSSSRDHSSVCVPRRGGAPLSAPISSRRARQRRGIRAAQAQLSAEAPGPCDMGSTHGGDAGSEQRPTTKLEVGPHPDLAIAGSRRAGSRGNPAIAGELRGVGMAGAAAEPLQARGRASRSVWYQASLSSRRDRPRRSMAVKTRRRPMLWAPRQAHHGRLEEELRESMLQLEGDEATLPRRRVARHTSAPDPLITNYR